MNGNQKKYSGNHLNSDQLLRYYRHGMTADENSAVLKHLDECELCSDALKGMSEMQNVMGIYNIIHDVRGRMRKRLVPKKKILYRFELITLLISFFIIGLILFLGYYFLVFRH